jgi:hypothetical protein
LFDTDKFLSEQNPSVESRLGRFLNQWQRRH